MSSLFAEVGLSVAFTLISLAPMAPDFFKGSNPGPQTRINVMAGLPHLSSDQWKDKDKAYSDLSYGGCAPDISLFNPNGDRVGFYRNANCDSNHEGNHISQNNPKDLWADYMHRDNNEKAEYMTVSAAGIDAICISAISVTYPSTNDIYAFLPGEVAAVCRDHNPGKYDYYWSESEASVQFKGPNGDLAMARPKCLWIDKGDKDGKKATRFQGFQVHLPDFKGDNKTFAGWQADPGQMCDSLARFGGYETLNVMMCPQIFSPVPMAGEKLPLGEVSACLPTAIPANDGKVYSDPCDDPRLSYQDRYNILTMYRYQCPTKKNYDWFWNCSAKEKGKCAKPRDPDSAMGPIGVKGRRAGTELFPTNSRFPASDHPLQKRFSGMLVKSRDVTQSAVRVCSSKGSVGPDFFSEHEQMFCDMDKRMLYPACTDKGEMGCFDTLYNETRLALKGIGKRDETKTYFHVRDWM